MIQVVLNNNENAGFISASKKMQEILNTKKAKKVFFVVPEQFTVEAESKLMSITSPKGLMDIEVISIKRLTTRIIEKSRTKMPPVLMPSGKAMVLNVVLNEINNDLKTFGGLSTKASFINDVSSLIGDYKKENILPEDINPHKFTGANTESTLYKKYEDLFKIYSSYNDFLGSEFVDYDDLTQFCCNSIDNANFIKDCEYLYFGFEGFDESDFLLMEKLSEMNLNQTYYFTCNSSSQMGSDKVYKVIYTTIDSIKSHCSKVAESCEIILNKENSVATKEDIRFLSDKLFTYENVKYEEPCEGIKLFKAANIYEEVEQTAIKILNLTRKGVSYKDILVLPSSFDEYKETITEIFNKYKINFFLDNLTHIMDTNVLRAVLGILNIVADNYETHDIIAFLKTDLTGLSKEEVSYIENYTLEFGIKGNMWAYPFKRNRKYGHGDNKKDVYDLDYLNNAKDKFIIPLINLKKELGKSNNIKTITEKLYDFLETFGLNEKIEIIIREFKNNEDYTTANKYAQIYNTIISTLEQLYDFLGEKEVTIKEYTKILESGFDSTEIGIIPSTVDCVNIGSLSRTRIPNIKHLFVLGTVDGNLPSNFSANTGIFSDKEKEESGEETYNIKYRTTNEYLSNEERYFLTNLFLKTEDCITFSYPTMNDNGDECIPSSIITRIKELFDLEEDYHDSKNIEDNIALITNYKATFKHLLNNMLNKNNDPEIQLLWNYVEQLYEKDYEGKQLLEMADKAINYSNDSEIKDKEMINELYNNKLYGSISSMQLYAQCPFKYFLDKIIKPVERKYNEITRPEIGSILHEIIKDFSDMIINNEVDINKHSREEIDNIAVQLTTAKILKFDSGKFGEIDNSPYFRETLLNASKYALNAIAYSIKNGAFSLESSELSFGDDKEGLKIITEKGIEVDMHGTVDRLDELNYENQDYIKVIDYKTGKDSFDLVDTYYGIKLQLPIYLKAMMEGNDKHSAGAFYFKIMPEIIEETSIDEAENNQTEFKIQKLNGLLIDNDELENKISNTPKNDIVKVKNSRYSTEEINTIINISENNIKRFAENIITGNFPITPYKKSGSDDMTACKYCKYKNICKHDTCLGSKYNILHKNTTDLKEEIKEIAKENVKKEAAENDN